MAPKTTYETASDLRERLTQAGIKFSPGETMPELKARMKKLEQKDQNEGNPLGKIKSDPMKGLSTLLKQDLVVICTELGEKPKGSIGDLLLKIRARMEELDDQKLEFGKYEELKTYSQLVAEKPEYLKWVIQEVESSAKSGKQLRTLAMYARLWYGKGPDTRKEMREKTKSDDSESEVETPQRMKTIPTKEGKDKLLKEEDPPNSKEKSKEFSQPSSSSGNQEPNANKADPKTKIPKPEWTGREEDLEMYVNQVREWQKLTNPESDSEYMKIGGLNKRK